MRNTGIVRQLVEVCSYRALSIVRVGAMVLVAISTLWLLILQCGSSELVRGKTAVN